MTWYLATVTHGIDAIAPFATGRHVYVSRMPTGTVRVIAAGGLTAMVKLDAARRCVRVVKDAAGRPVRVRQQVKQEIRWNERREARRFFGGPRSRLVA